MKPSSRFSLADHPGAREAWPLRSRLLADGQQTLIDVSGYALLHQFETPAGYLLVTDFDCPFEESTVFTLISGDVTHILSERSLTAPYCSYLLKSISWNDGWHFTAFFENERGSWQFTVRNWGIPYLRPRLKMQKLTPVNGGVD